MRRREGESGKKRECVEENKFTNFFSLLKYFTKIEIFLQNTWINLSFSLSFMCCLGKIIFLKHPNNY